jgi:hypothetical protein
MDGSETRKPDMKEHGVNQEDTVIPRNGSTSSDEGVGGGGGKVFQAKKIGVGNTSSD